MKKILCIIGFLLLQRLESKKAGPDFMILGVTKCGTTSLYHYMKQHPQISGALTKEIHFFDKYFDKGFAWYERQFPTKADGRLRGEATPSYFWIEHCTKKIVRYYPKTKFIVMFRDPVKRIISEYFRLHREGVEHNSFETAIARKDKRGNVSFYDRYVKAGFYSDHLSRWLSYIPEKQLHIVIFEDLAADPEREVNKVFKFLGIKEHTLESYKIRNEARYDATKIRPKTIKGLKRVYKSYNQRLEQYLGRKLPWN